MHYCRNGHCKQPITASLKPENSCHPYYKYYPFSFDHFEFQSILNEVLEMFMTLSLGMCMCWFAEKACMPFIKSIAVFNLLAGVKHAQSKSRSKKSNFHSRTIAKVSFSTFNFETGQHRPSNCQNRANLALGVVLKVVLHFLKN